MPNKRQQAKNAREASNRAADLCLLLQAALLGNDPSLMLKAEERALRFALAGEADDADLLAGAIVPRVERLTVEALADIRTAVDLELKRRAQRDTAAITPPPANA